MEKVRPEPAAGSAAREADDFLLRPPTHPLLVPARAPLWRRVAHLAYAALPPYAHEPYGGAAPRPATVTRRLRLTGLLLRRFPARVRWQLPPGRIPRTVARPGPDARPAPYTLGRRAAILGGPRGRADSYRGERRARWGTAGSSMAVTGCST
jgi:hypothetical protein